MDEEKYHEMCDELDALIKKYTIESVNDYISRTYAQLNYDGPY